MKNIFGAIVFRDVLKWRSSRPKYMATQWRSLYSKSRKKNIRIKDLNSALKPFFFMVHPDLFGNFPEKRDVNEDSLKKLNSFLQTLMKTGPRNGSVSLKFFVRDPKQPDLDSFSEISVNLCGSTSPLNEVEKILKSVGLPGLFSNRERVTKLPSWKGRPIQHHMDKKDKDDGTIPIETLLTFLQQKAPLAKVHLAKTTKLKKQISMLNEKICHDFGFKSLSVECNWRFLLIHGFLKNFYSLLERHRNDIQKASGWKVVLGSWGGIDSEGVINLNIEDEPLTWIWLLASVDRYSMILLEIQHLKCAISQMLGGLTIVDVEYDHKKHHLEEFRASLNDLYFNLKSTAGLNKVNLPLDNYKGIITWCVKKTPILPSGLFRIPLSMDGFEIISFLATSVAQARKAKEVYQRELLKEKQIIDLCIKHLQLQSLSRSTNINHFEMISCCENLVDISCAITESLVVKVDQNYYASADGELTIPWNWKERG